MEGKCSKYPECPAPTHCHEGNDVATCEFWLTNNSPKEAKKEKSIKEHKQSNLPWTGEPFLVEDIPQVSFRSSPIILGIVGKADAGKTTFLAMLYTLLLNGKSFDNFSFAGTKTIIGWDKLHHKLKVEKNDVAFPDPTDPKYHRLFHFALRNNNNVLKDILFSDASGEAFSWWALKREDANAEAARWIYKHSHGFILFVDCENLITGKNAAKTKIIDIAQMLRHDLKNRPVITVWSKADKKQSIPKQIQESLKEELASMFANYTELDISNFPSDEPDPIVHENNLKVVDWILSKTIIATGKEFKVETQNTNDTFLNYRGNE
jgi:hypothetical protein